MATVTFGENGANLEGLIAFIRERKEKKLRLIHQTTGEAVKLTEVELKKVLGQRTKGICMERDGNKVKRLSLNARSLHWYVTDTWRVYNVD